MWMEKSGHGGGEMYRILGFDPLGKEGHAMQAK